MDPVLTQAETRRVLSRMSFMDACQGTKRGDGEYV